jgi:hypothetical protein
VSLPTFHVIGDAFLEFERTVLAPELARLTRHAVISVELLLRHRQDIAIDIGHLVLPWFSVKMCRRRQQGSIVT